MKFLLLLLITFNLYASNTLLINEYNSLKTKYLRAVLNSDEKNQTEYLKKIVEIGKKLNKDVSRYEKELNKNSTTTTKQTTLKIENKQEPVKEQTSYKKVTLDKSEYKNSSFNIDSVYVKDNTIIVNFKHYVKEDFINFIEEKKGSYFYDIFDFKGKFKDASPTKLEMNSVNKIKIYQVKDRVLRIELREKKNLQTIYIINKKSIIIKVLDDDNKNDNYTKAKSAKIIKSKNKNKVVVIDAGHGGKDAGAIGSGKKQYEKFAVFSVMQYVYNTLKSRGYTVYMTRNKDKFIKVKNRTVLANEKEADVFVSIHANAAPKSVKDKARGIETYFLSPAKSERAKRVAALENKSDMGSMNDLSQNTFLTVLNQSKITASQKLGIDVQQHMLYSTRQLYKDVVDGGVREGPFWVLVGAQMPSILIEIGYITHETEGKRIFEKRYQKSLAVGIADGIEAYFDKNDY